MSKTKAVIYWPDTEQVSTIDLSLINEEDRYQNAVTTIKLKGNKYHKAVVRLISSDKLKLEETELQVGSEIEEKLKAQELESIKKGGRGARNRKQCETVGAASNNQVAASLGEKLKATSAQAIKTKELALEKKQAAAAQKSANDDVDRVALKSIQHRQSNAKRTLTFSGPDEEDESETEKGPTSDSDSIVNLDSNDDDDDEEATMAESTSNCCIHCLELRKACNQSPSLFVKALGKFTGATFTAGTQYLDILEVPDSVGKTELSKGSRVFISNADKNAIKRDGGGDPSKMTRLGLLALFGRENMEREQVTAKGQKRGTKGIKKNVRDALRAFVNRNKAAAYSELDETKFNQVINKKKSSIHRVRKSPNVEKAKKTVSNASKITSPTKRIAPSSAEASMRDNVYQSPSSGQSPVKASSGKSPRKSLSGKSPLKVVQNSASQPSPSKVRQSPRKVPWTVVSATSDTGAAGPNATYYNWGSYSGAAQQSEGGYSSCSYNQQQQQQQQPEYNSSYSSSYPIGQGNYSSQAQNWYIENMGDYLQ